MLSQHAQLGDVQALDWLRVIAHAFPLDLSVASYIMVLFGLLLVVSFFAPARIIARISDIYTYVILLITVAVFGTDIGVFPAWGFHPDKTLFIYLASPKEVLACAPWYVWVCGIAAMILVWALLCLAYRRWMNGLDEIPTQDSWPKRCGYAFAMLLITGALFLPIRGSLSTSTMNTGRVYFSENQMLNQSAVNPIFNIIESMGVQPFDTQRYTYMPTEEAEQINEARENHYISQKASQSPSEESLAEVSGNQTSPPSEGLEEASNFSTLDYAGTIDFTNPEAADRGVVAALSGFPGQPTSSLMVVPGKTKNLPQLGKSLLAEGYQLKFWYGGDEDFTSMRSYLIDGGFVQRVSDHSFPVSQRLSKWGVPDHVLLPLAADEIAHRNSPSPTLDVILTLSSHEPFEVPTTDRFHDPYLNSIAYTDSCLGAFVDTLCHSPQWSNTLLVFMADHGYPYPYDIQNHEPRRYAIPVVWAGGAVAAHREIKTLCSQIDIVPTILSQMDIDHSDYWFGKDILDSTAVPFAFYSFNDGFALLTPQDTVVIDAKANTCIIGQEGETETRARAFMQRVMETIDSRL